MTAGLYNFTCTKGSALNIVITLKNPDQTKPNIQGWNSRMQIRSTVEASSTMIELTTLGLHLIYFMELAYPLLLREILVTFGYELTRESFTVLKVVALGQQILFR
jgi:hypothetical protein